MIAGLKLMSHIVTRLTGVKSLPGFLGIGFVLWCKPLLHLMNHVARYVGIICIEESAGRLPDVNLSTIAFTRYSRQREQFVD